MIHGREQVSVRSHGGESLLFSHGVVLLKAARLLLRVGELLVAVGQLQPAVIDLEASCDQCAVTVLMGLCQRGGPAGEVTDHRELVDRQGGFDLCRHQVIHCRGFFQTCRGAMVLGAFSQGFVCGGQGVQAGGLQEEGAEAIVLTAGIRKQLGQQRQALVDQLLERKAGAVPLQHGEFRVVSPSGFAISECLAGLVDRSTAGGQQALHVILGGALQIAVAGYRYALDVGVADAEVRQLWGVHFQHFAGIKKGAHRA